MVRPYKTRFILGILCGILSGMFAPALPFVANYVVMVVFSTRYQPIAPPASGNTNTTVIVPHQVADAPTRPQTVTNQVAAATNAPLTLIPTSALGRLPQLEFLNRWFDKLIPKGPASKGMILLAIGLVPLVMLTRNLLGYLNMYLMSWVGVRALQNLRLKIFDHLMRLPMSYFGRTSTGELLTRLGEVWLLQATITNTVSIIVRDPISVISSAGLSGLSTTQAHAAHLPRLSPLPVADHHLWPQNPEEHQVPGGQLGGPHQGDGGRVRRESHHPRLQSRESGL